MVRVIAMTAFVLVLEAQKEHQPFCNPLSITCDSGLQVLVYGGSLILLAGRLLTIYQRGLVFSAETPFVL